MNKSFLSEEAKKRLIEILENKYPILVRRISQLDNDRIKLFFSVAESFRLPIDVMHDIEISKDVISAVIYLEQLANMFGSLIEEDICTRLTKVLEKLFERVNLKVESVQELPSEYVEGYTDLLATFTYDSNKPFINTPLLFIKSIEGNRITAVFERSDVFDLEECLNS